MSNIQVPPVTLEDLQAFQAKHFPGSGQPFVSEYSYNDTVTDDFAGDGDDLGYYPDGVKRTLTDEQIRIFRHSEIHSLLRERQLKEEEEELAQRYLESKDKGDNVTETAVKRPNATVGETDKLTGEIQDAVTLQSDSKNVAVRRQTEDTSRNPMLDYDEDTAPSASQKPAPSWYVPQVAGRRIVSYED
ncbi:hypothetical protein BBP40_007778 [Aspergillus hancockii]|nr:hypothetical protein BBP40_007778 [Aspergillus hancockii]